MGVPCPLRTYPHLRNIPCSNKPSGLVAQRFASSGTFTNSSIDHGPGANQLFLKIPLAGDIRPFFTMQDNDHAQLVNRLPPKAGLILGVTNPFFEKSCSHWPHVLSLGRSARYDHLSRGKYHKLMLLQATLQNQRGLHWDPQQGHRLAGGRRRTSDTFPKIGLC